MVQALTRRGSALVLLLGAALLMSGCAAGSPSVVAPAAPEASEVVAAAPTSPVAARQEVSAAPAEAALPAVADPETPMPAGDIAAAEAPETAGESIAFVEDSPQMSAAIAHEAPETTAAPLQVASALAQRPPPPPDPGTGQSQIVEGGGNGRLEVALTFDAGADTGYAAEILDLLRDEGIPATFGMTGLWAQANPGLVQRMAAEGHQLINHTWDHASLTGANTGMPAMTPEQVAQQLGDTEALVRELTGDYEMRPYFRPPYGDYDATSLGYLYDNGYYLSIWWTCDTRGWAGWGAQEIVDYCTTNLVEDEILLLHVGAAAAGDFEALPALIDFFRTQGYVFVTIEQMLQP